jgi:hypothetical protein
LDSIPNNNLANSTITFAGTTGSDAVALGETLTFGSGTGHSGTSLVASTAGANAVTLDVRLATTTAVGVASFNSTYFDVTAGAVSIIPESVGSWFAVDNDDASTEIGAAQYVLFDGVFGVAQSEGLDYITTVVVTGDGDEANPHVVQLEVNNFRTTLNAGDEGGAQGVARFDMGASISFLIKNDDVSQSALEFDGSDDSGGNGLRDATVTLAYTGGLKEQNDVNPTLTPAAGKVLYYDAGDGYWTTGDLGTLAAQTGGIGIALDNLNDVDTTGAAAGRVLVKATGTGYKLAPFYYVHTQGSSSATWTVNHGLGQKFCNVTVVDSADDVIIPQSITFNSTTQLTVVFNTSITGTVVVMGLAIPA